MEDWVKRARQNSVVIGETPDWARRARETSVTTDVFGDAGPIAANIDDSEDAPAMVRMEVGALDKPEDRLAAIRKTFPDAKPYGDDNFIYTDGKGKTRLYNTESWFPGLGDFASIIPEASEGVGAAIGGTLGGIAGLGTGAAVGSVVPGPGTVAGGGYGAVTGAMAGAGSGAILGRELSKLGMNYAFGNDDTRTQAEVNRDILTTGLTNAAGEGVGRAVGYGAKAGWDGAKKMMIGGGVMDAPEKIAQRVEDFRSIGYEPTSGMVSGSERQAVLEHALKSTIPGQKIEGRIKDAFTAQRDAFDGISDSMNGGRVPMSKAQMGDALRAQTEAAKKAGFARSDALYDKIPGDARAVVTNTSDFLKRMTDERAGMGQFDQIARGSQTDSVISQARAIVADAQTESGWNLDKLKQARTYIGKAAQNENDPVMQGNLNSLYSSLTNDIEASAATAGPDALQAFNKANNNYRRLVSEDRFGKGGVADKILNNKDTDKIHDLIFNGRKDGGNTISAARRNIVRSPGGKEAWDELSGSFVQRIGTKMTEDGPVYDPTTFFKNWKEESFSTDAKNALFKGSKNQKFREDLDVLSRIADNMKRYGKHDNHSNTAKHQTALGSLNLMNRNNVIATALGTSAYMMDPTALALTAVGIGGKMLTQKSRATLLTSPETVSWLAGVPKADMQRGGIKSYMKKLVNIGKATPNPALSGAIDDYLRDLNYSDDQ